MFITGGSPINHKKLIWRPRGFLVMAVAASSLYLYSRFVFDAQLKGYLEKELTQLNGARVNIGSVKSDFFRGKFTLSNIELGNPVTPMRNTFHVGKVTTHFAIAPLFRRKLHIDEMRIEGVKYWTQRTEPGNLSEDASNAMVRAALLDRVSPGIYSGIRNELLDNPLRHLGQLGSGFTLSSKLGVISDKLQSVRHLRETLGTLKERESEWEKQKAELPSPAVLYGLKERLLSNSKIQETDLTPKEELRTRIETIQKDLGNLNEEISKLSSELSKSDDFLPHDIKVVRTELGLPNTNHQDLTNLIFGPTWLGLLEKLSYWLEYSRSRSPVASKTDTYSIAVYTHDHYRAIRFGKVGATPAFILEKAMIKSGSDAGSSEVKIDGEIRGLNSNPRLYGRPSTIKIAADYPEQGLRHLNFNAVIDHSEDVPKENIDISVASFKLLDWPITRTPDVQLEIGKGRASLKLNGDFTGNEINLAWDISLSETEYGIHSRFRHVEQALEEMLAGLYSFDLTGKISGPLNALSFESSSRLGQRLAEGLRSEFKHEYEALNEAISNETKNLFPPLKEEISTRLRKLQDQTRPAFEQALKKLQELQAQTS